MHCKNTNIERQQIISIHISDQWNRLHARVARCYANFKNHLIMKTFKTRQFIINY